MAALILAIVIGALNRSGAPVPAVDAPVYGVVEQLAAQTLRDVDASCADIDVTHYANGDEVDVIAVGRDCERAVWVWADADGWHIDTDAGA